MMASDVTGPIRLLPGFIEPPGRRILLDLPQVPGISQEANPQASFGEMLGNLINGVNDAQLQSGEIQQALLAGEPVELHDVMIKAEQAGLTMDLLLEIRNKLVNAHNELMRMPV